jgi:hypothetical protein
VDSAAEPQTAQHVDEHGGSHPQVNRPTRAGQIYAWKQLPDRII